MSQMFSRGGQRGINRDNGDDRGKVLSRNSGEERWLYGMAVFGQYDREEGRLIG